MENGLWKFHIWDSFMGRYEKLIREEVIPYQEKALKDEIPGAEKSHCIENFRLAAEKLRTGKCSGDFYGMVFQDSDVAKWLEGAAYSLVLFPDPELERRCDEIIDLIGEAQQPDGYLNTFFTVKRPGQRWTCLWQAHELYCAGHLIEAAVAYDRCTGKKKLLEIMCRMADHIYTHFIEEGAEGYPGHPEIELALMRLYHHTKNRKYLELAEHFINVRGVDPEYYAKEREKYGWDVWGGNPHDTAYNQADKPVRQQDQATGHAVRAVYLYTGMADVARETGDEELLAACRRLWDNVVERRMYVTGAIGSAYEGEAFTADYHLPNDTAYAETCASIGLIFFARQMLSAEKNSKYADVMERALYNCVLAGMQLDGKRFFYVNPLESLPGISGVAVTHRHALPERPKWFTCACCPPNVARLLPSLANYAWDMEDGTVYHHLFIGGELDLREEFGGTVTVETGYPYDGNVTYRFRPEAESMEMTLAVRIPGFSRHTAIRKNGEEISCERKDGYAYLHGTFTENDTIVIELDMSVQTIYANSRISADSGKVAFQRGPLVYCAEQADNLEGVLPLAVRKNAAAEAKLHPTPRLHGIVKLELPGYRIQEEQAPYSFDRPARETCEITLIPYYAWANRGKGEMRVWLPEAE